MPARRKRQYLIGVRPVISFAQQPADAIHDALNHIEDIEILRRLRRRGLQGLGATALPGEQEVVVVRMDEKRAEALRQSAPLHVLIEQDVRLSTGQGLLPIPFAAPWFGRTIPSPRRRKELRFYILGEDEKPLSDTSITVFSKAFAAQAITDSHGAASVAIFDAESDIDDIRAVYVQPAANHWECFVQDPALDPNEANVIKLNPLFSAGKPSEERRTPWPIKVMNLDRPQLALTGAGVKIGLIDTGCDNNHPLLRHITRGVDLTRSGTKEWTQDEIGQGTHCAGIIAGTGGTVPGQSGIAPAAEIHVFKLSPGGHFSDLIEALDQCIERQLDIVHLGVGCPQISELVTHKILEARLKGVACIAAAGDTGGPAQFPASVPGVLSVSAIGKLNEYPQDTHHGLTAIPELVGPSGLFATNFSASGPQIGLCAPGVAVISSVPGGGLAARDGTAVAAAHVVGFAALVVAHHPLFRGVYQTRSEQRVTALIELLRGSAVAPVFDPLRVGAGLPDILRVPGLGSTDVEAWSNLAQNFGVFAGAREIFQDRLPIGVPRPDLAGAMALMQLRANGLI